MSVIFQCLKKCDIQYLPSLYQINARWRTKPRWVPIAKTKMFRVNPRIKIPHDDEVEFKRINRLYRTHMKSLKNLFDEVHRANETSEEVLLKLEQEKEEHWNKCVELNKKWNEEIAIQRAIKDAQALEDEMAAARETIRLTDEKHQQRLEELEEIIRQEKEASKHFITAENIDEAIEKVLNSVPHTFNYAIDREGRIYSGLSLTPDIDVEAEKNQENDKISSRASE